MILKLFYGSSSLGRAALMVALGILPLAALGLNHDPLSGQVPGSPRIECDNPLVEWGELIKETPFNHEFEIKNTGDEVLIIQKVNGT